MLVSPHRKDRFGSQRETSSRIMMAWHGPNRVPQMNQLKLCETPPQNRSLPKTQHATEITWGSLKKISQKPEKILQMTGQAHTPENMFLAMLSVINTTSVMVGTFYCLIPGAMATDYWAYMLNPPLWKPLTWATAPFPVYNNNSNWIGGTSFPFTQPQFNGSFWAPASNDNGVICLRPSNLCRLL